MEESSDDIQLHSEIDIKQEEVDESLLAENIGDEEVSESEEIVGFSIQEIKEDPEADPTYVPLEEFVPLQAHKKVIVYQLQSTNTVEFKCEVCEKLFTNLEMLMQHKNIHEEMTHCHICHDKIMKKALQFHIELEHRDALDPPPPEEPKKARKRKILEATEEVIDAAKSRKKVIIHPEACWDDTDSASEGEIEVKKEPQIKEEPPKVTKPPPKVLKEKIVLIAAEELTKTRRKYFKQKPSGPRPMTTIYPEHYEPPEIPPSNLKFKPILPKLITKANNNEIPEFHILPPAPPHNDQQVSFKITEIPSTEPQDEVIEIEDDEPENHSESPEEDPKFEYEDEGSDQEDPNFEGSDSSSSESDSDSDFSYPAPRNPAIVKRILAKSRKVLRFTCKVCQRKFASSADLKKHRERHERDVECKICGCFLAEKYLKGHLEAHGPSQLVLKKKEVKPEVEWECSVCGAGFKNESSLVQHETIHGQRIVYTIDGKVGK